MCLVLPAVSGKRDKPGYWIQHGLCWIQQSGCKALRLTQAGLWLRGFTVSVSVPDTELDGKTSGSSPEPESSCHQGFKGTICAM